MNTWKPIAAALVIFAAGVLTGAFAVQLRPSHAAPITSANPPIEALAIHSNRLDATPTPRSHPLGAEVQLRDLSQRIGRFLDLTPQQRERIRLILNETQDNMRALANEISPRTREELRRMRERIRAELTAEQRREFESLFRNRENRPRRPEASSTPIPNS